MVFEWVLLRWKGALNMVWKEEICDTIKFSSKQDQKSVRSGLDGPDCMGGYRHIWHALKMQGISVPVLCSETFAVMFTNFCRDVHKLLPWCLQTISAVMFSNFCRDVHELLPWISQTFTVILVGHHSKKNPPNTNNNVHNFFYTWKKKKPVTRFLVTPLRRYAVTRYAVTRFTNNPCLPHWPNSRSEPVKISDWKSLNGIGLTLHFIYEMQFRK